MEGGELFAMPVQQNRSATGLIWDEVPGVGTPGDSAPGPHQAGSGGEPKPEEQGQPPRSVPGPSLWRLYRLCLARLHEASYPQIGSGSVWKGRRNPIARPDCRAPLLKDGFAGDGQSSGGDQPPSTRPASELPEARSDRQGVPSPQGNAELNLQARIEGDIKTEV